jgi:hypothetical protein
MFWGSKQLTNPVRTILPAPLRGGGGFVRVCVGPSVLPEEDPSWLPR